MKFKEKYDPAFSNPKSKVFKKILKESEHFQKSKKSQKSLFPQKISKVSKRCKGLRLFVGRCSGR